MEEAENNDNESIDYSGEEEKEQAGAVTVEGIYSYTIAGTQELKSVQLIASWVSERFENIITGMDIEQLLMSMKECQALRT